MKRYVVVGLLVFLAFGISLAPASLVGSLLSTNSQAHLIETRGSLWRGQGQLFVAQSNLGLASWVFQSSGLFRGSAAYEWTLQQNQLSLSGDAEVDFSEAMIQAEGNIDANTINDWLRPYDITIRGAVSIVPSQLKIDLNSKRINFLDGQLDWQGGLVRYTLSGLVREAVLPAMTGYLSINDQGQPQAIVYAVDEQTPLIVASLNEQGYAKIGITKLFTKLLNNPWPGSDPDHTVVLQVEEKII